MFLTEVTKNDDVGNRPVRQALSNPMLFSSIFRHTSVKHANMIFYDVLDGIKYPAIKNHLRRVDACRDEECEMSQSRARGSRGSGDGSRWSGSI